MLVFRKTLAQGLIEPDPRLSFRLGKNSFGRAFSGLEETSFVLDPEKRAVKALAVFLGGIVKIRQPYFILVSRIWFLL